MEYDWNEEIKQDIQKFIHKSHSDTRYMDIFIPAYRAPDLLKYLHDECPEVQVDEARYLEKTQRHHYTYS